MKKPLKSNRSHPSAPSGPQEDAPLESFELVSRHLIMEKDLNHFGNLFGGSLLYWIDEGSFLFAISKCGYANLVTVSLDDVVFRAPGHRGDSIAIYCRLLETGHSSLRVQTRVVVEDVRTGEKRTITNSRVSFVALKEDRPYAYFRSAEYQEFLKRR